MTQIVGLVRFTLLSTTRNPFQAWDGDFTDYAAQMLSAERMQSRFDVFESVTLPSLRSQTDKDFVVILLAPRLLPKRWRRRIEKLLVDNDFLRVHYFKETNLTLDKCHDTILDHIDITQPFATFRLDDDDGLSADFIERLRPYVQPQFVGFGVSMTQGILLDIRRETGLFGIAPFDQHNVGLGLALVSGPEQPRTIFDITDLHLRFHKRVPVISDGRRPAYVVVTHSNNDTGDERKIGSETITLTGREAMRALRKKGILINLKRLCGRWGMQMERDSEMDSASAF